MSAPFSDFRISSNASEYEPAVDLVCERCQLATSDIGYGWSIADLTAIAIAHEHGRPFK